MSVELLQRHGLLRRTYTLADDGIRVSERSLTSGRTVTVPYEVMFADRQEVFVASKRALIAAVAMAVLAVVCAFLGDAEPDAWLFWAIFAALAGAYYWASRRDQVGFVDPKAKLFFLRDKPSHAALEEFVAEARARARDKIRGRILPLRPTGDEKADRERASWLRETGIITDEEHAAFTRGFSPPLDSNDHESN